MAIRISPGGETLTRKQFRVLSHGVVADASSSNAIDGTGDVTFAVAALDSVGLETFTGTAGEVFTGPGLASFGAEGFVSTGAETFAGPGLSSSGLETFTGSGDETIGGPALAGTALNALSASGNVTFVAASLDGAGSETFAGTAAVSFASAQDASGAESFTGLAAMAFAGPVLDGGTPQPVDGGGDSAIHAPLLLGYGLGAPEPAFEVVGQLGYPIRYQPAVSPEAVSGTGRLTVQAPRYAARGARGITGAGSMAIAAPQADGLAQQAITGAGGIAIGLDVQGTGGVLNRRIVSVKAAHPRRELAGCGHLVAWIRMVGTGDVQPPDAVDREWTVLQQAHDGDALDVVLT